MPEYFISTGPSQLPVRDESDSESFHRERTRTVYTTSSRGSSIPERTIRFREQLVSFSSSPPSFNRDLSVTAADVIVKYKASCEHYKVRPLTTIITTIEEYSENLFDRIPLLSLKEEKLDSRIVESLEEVFRNVQCNVLDLENSNLDDQCASALFDMVEYYETAFCVKIGANARLTPHCWLYVYQLLRRCPFITEFHCQHSEFFDNAMVFFARSLRNCSFLTTLHIEQCHLSGRQLLLLATAMKINIYLKELYLGSNGLTSQDAMQLGGMLKFNSNLEVLDLRNNVINDTGVVYLCEGLKDQIAGLQSLTLWNNQLTKFSCQYLAGLLSIHKTLDSLNLGANDLKNEGACYLKEGLLRSNSIVKLGLNSTKIESEGAVAIAEFIAVSQTIVRIDLRENILRTAGLMALAHAVKLNYTIHRLDIDEVPRRESLRDFQSIYLEFAEQIQFLLRRNKSIADESEARKAILARQASYFARSSISSRLDQDSGPCIESYDHGNQPPVATRERSPSTLYKLGWQQANDTDDTEHCEEPDSSLTSNDPTAQKPSSSETSTFSTSAEYTDAPFDGGERVEVKTVKDTEASDDALSFNSSDINFVSNGDYQVSV